MGISRASLIRRLDRLAKSEAEIAAAIRLIISTCGKPLNWSTSTCARRVAPNGCLTEIVTPDGSSSWATSEEIDEFVSTFPLTQR